MELFEEPLVLALAKTEERIQTEPANQPDLQDGDKRGKKSPERFCMDFDI